ncbi:MAG: tyrosine-type recombinase/integrase [Candidatus Solibacter sp.]
MNRIRVPLVHPLKEVFFTAIESVTSSLGASSKGRYRTTVAYFLRYLGRHHPSVQTLDQLRRDPHFLGWFTWLSSQKPPLVKSTRCLHVVTLRRVIEELAWLHEMPALARLFHPDDIPRFDHRLPRPLTPEQDRLIQEELMRRNDVASNALLLVRRTGIRIGECVDLPLDCLRSLAPGQWALHVPLGKLYTERLVPIDDSVQQIVYRLRFFRSLRPDPPDGLLLARRRGRNALMRTLRTELLHVRTTLGIERRITPHMFRHTYATEMLRAGVSFPALMKLLGHASPEMTMNYAELTPNDVYREFHALRSPARHGIPSPKASSASFLADLPSSLHAIQSAQHVLEMFRRTLTKADSASAVLDRMLNRLTKIAAELRKLASE